MQTESEAASANPKVAAAAIEVLADYGWLVPVMAPRRDAKWWEIIRPPEQPVATI
jgi:hypothetical protein